MSMTEKHKTVFLLFLSLLLQILFLRRQMDSREVFKSSDDLITVEDIQHGFYYTGPRLITCFQTKHSRIKYYPVWYIFLVSMEVLKASTCEHDTERIHKDLYDICACLFL